MTLPAVTAFGRTVAWPRTLVVVAATFGVLAVCVWGTLSLVWSRAPVEVNVRWKAQVDDALRAELERRFELTSSRQAEGTTWQYQLIDSSTSNIRAIVQSEYVDDTEHLNRTRFRPEFTQDRERQILLYSLGAASVGTAILLVLGGGLVRRGSFPVTATRAVAPGPVPPLTAVYRRRIVDGIRKLLRPGGYGPSAAPFSASALFIAVAIGVGATLAMITFAGATAVSAAGALLFVFPFGYCVGSLLVHRGEGFSWVAIRTVGGLLLTSVAFLLALVLSLPWFVAPGVLLIVALWVRGRSAYALSPVGRPRADDVVALLLALVIVSPIAITFAYMVPGRFAPVFYNVDTPSVLEKVHALTRAESYPPESLSNLGARRTYHYGTQAMAAVISKTTGLLPHHALFGLVLPLLTIGVAAAAFAAARHIGPNVPRSLAVPLLLLSIPSLSHSLWQQFGPQLWTAAASGPWSIDGLVGDVGLWGVLSNEAKNVGGDYVILTTLAGIAAAPVMGWWLPAFLAGTAILVKTPAGVGLVAGLMLAASWHTVRSRRWTLWPIAITAGLLFLITFAAFFAASESAFQAVPSALHHFRGIVSEGSGVWILVDIAWLLLPALIVMSARLDDPEQRSTAFLLIGIAPIVIVNVSNLEHVADTGGGAGDDWLQILHVVPFAWHAFALSLASSRWERLGSGTRAAVLVSMALLILPAAAAAGRYSFLLLQEPASGHEYVDNRPLAEALAVIPTSGAVIVTNDLRYPAQNFSREERQMQIPALFGHQAFAANYAYEVVPSSHERRQLQKLLQQPEWREDIPDAARAHGWTHLLVRKDYVHPEPIPLERIFDNDAYTVFRFPIEP